LFFTRRNAVTLENIPMVSYTADDEKIIRFMTETKGDEIELVTKLLGRTDEEQLLSSTYAFATYVYMIYNAVRDEFGSEKGHPMYMGLWFVLGDWCMKTGMKKAGIKDLKEIKDIPTMAKVFQTVMNAMGDCTVITESSDDRAVVDMIFCYNPLLGMGPWDRYIDRVRYYKDTDSSYEIGYGKFCSAFPGMCGLGDRVEGGLTHIMCLAEGPTCRTVFEMKKRGEKL